MKKILILSIVIACLSSSAQAQIFSNKEVSKKHQDKIDSLKESEYPYILPIWGSKATAAGFSLPLSAGLGLNYLWQESSIIIENLNVGFNGGQMYNLDNIVRFDEAISRSQGLNVRPDVWLFPFLNVYGILAAVQTSTDVNFGVWIPDTTSYQELFSASTTADFNGTTFGFGLTPTIGVAGGFLAVDMNFTWTDLDALSKPAQAFVIAPRFGKSFRVSKRRLDRSVAVWVGAFRLNIRSETAGSIPLSDLSDFEEVFGKIDDGKMRVEDAQVRLDEWWNGLTDQEQAIREPIYDKANDLLQRTYEVLNGAENAAENVESSTVQYTLDKRQKNLWNMVVGAQYQHNKHFMVRAEYGFLGSRDQLLVGLQYRFGL